MYLKENEVSILIVDDVEDNLDMMIEICEQEGWTVDSANCGKDAIEKLKQKNYDILVSDLKLGDIDGLRLAVFAKSLDRYMEVIIVTAYSTLETAVESIREDIFDYIFKPFFPRQLSSSVRKALKNRKLVLENLKLIEKLKIQEKILEEKFKKTMDELIKANEQLAELAVKDELTKLYNYRYFRVRLDDEIERAERYGSCFALAMFDLDDFKQINDTYGHETGNIVLSKTAELINNSIRNVDIPARYGGEEFMVLLPMIKEQAMIVAQRIVNSIRNYRFVSTDGINFQVTASGGVSIFPLYAENVKEIVGSVDKALYKAKYDGKDRVVFYGDMIKEEGDK